MKLAYKMVITVCISIISILPAEAVEILVPGTSDPWLAGMPDGSTASVGDVAPEQSPVPVPGIPIGEGLAYSFSASGEVRHEPGQPGPPFFGPDGNQDEIVTHITGAENGIATLTAPIDALIGVFLGPDQPNLSPAPQHGLNFSEAASRDYCNLYPLLKQPFFIGDGNTSSGATQRVIAPAGATRLFLGTMDGFEWSNNEGQFVVTVVYRKEFMITFDNVPDGSCVGPGDDITYSICYDASGYSDTNVVITDYLPPEVNFVWASNDAGYDPCTNAVTWNIGTMGPNDSDCLTLIVNVNGNAKPCGEITNYCELRGDYICNITAYEDTPVCYLTLTEHSKWSQPPIEINPDPCSLNPPVYCGWDVNSHHELPYFECWGPDWPRQCHGDADNKKIVRPWGDIYVTDDDADILAAAWGGIYPDPCYNACADFDRDLVIGRGDSNILEQWQGKTGVPICPVPWANIPSLGGTEYYDLFAVNLSPKGFYWDLVDGGSGNLTDPLVSLEPAGESNIDSCTPLEGIAWGFGGLDWIDGVLESDAGSYSIELKGEPNYYLSVVLDTATTPKSNGNMSSWGTIKNIEVRPWDSNEGWWGERIEPNWVMPFDPNGGTVVIPGLSSTVKLAINDFNVDSLDTQDVGIWGAAAKLPPAAGYQVNFNSDVYTWDSYDTISPTPILTWQVAADDFRCLENMPVTSVHWWGSYIGWEGDEPPLMQPGAWRIGFWSNVAEDPNDPNSFSRPEKLLWQIEERAPSVEVQYVGQDNFPNKPADSCFQYHVELLEEEVFWQHTFLDQTEDDTFWLSIAAVYPLGAPVDYRWGWKTRPAGWMDGAVKCHVKNPYVGIVLEPNSVEPIEECGQSYDLSFELGTDPTYIKAEQAYDSIRHWPYYHDEKSMAIVEPNEPNIIRLVADDWKCEKQTPITAAVWWGSYIGYRYQPCQCEPTPIPPQKPVYFLLSIWTDVPDPNPGDPCTFSHPGEKLWQYEAHEYDEVLVGYDKHPDGDANEPVFRYSVRMKDPNDWFCQEDVNGIYWFSVAAVYDTTDPCYPWGWTNHKCVTWEPEGLGEEIAYWKLNETSGTIAYDSSGNGNNGTLVNGPTWTAGKICGGALEFDGIDDYVDCGNNASLNISDAITIAVWVKTNDSGNSEDNPYVTKGDHSYAIKHYRGNSIEFFIYDEDWWQDTLFPVDSSFNDDWHHLAGTYDGNQVKLYIDGVLQDTTDHTGSIDSNTFAVNLGRNSEFTDRYYDGLLDDVRIYDRALSAREVRSLSDMGKNDNATAWEQENGQWKWKPLTDQTDTSEDMSFILFTDCFPCCHKDYHEWLSVSAGRPSCWCNPRQCHGDVDNAAEGGTKTGYNYVHFNDLSLLLDCWDTLEPNYGNPYPSGPGAAWHSPCICADFCHDVEGGTKTGYYRVHFCDLTILLSSWNILEPNDGNPYPGGPGIDPNCLDCP